MPKLIINGLDKIQAFYSYQQFQTNEWATGALNFCFANEKHALEFYQNVKDCNNTHLGDEGLFFYNDYPLQLDCYKHYVVKLHIPTNTQKTAYPILEYLMQHFELPKQLEVHCPAINLEKDFTVSIPMANAAFISRTLSEFLPMVALLRSRLQSNLSALIEQRTVLVNTVKCSRTTDLQITCDTQEDANLLKKKLFVCAVDKGVESQLRFQKVTNVTGVAYGNMFLLSVESKLDFHAMLDELEATLTAPLKQLSLAI